MINSVALYSLAVRAFSVLGFGLALVNAALVLGFRSAGGEPGSSMGWMLWIGVLNALLVVGVAFMAGDAGLAGGPADGAARRRLLGLTTWLPGAAFVIVALNLAVVAFGIVGGGAVTVRQIVGLLILVGWSLFGWAAVLRWLRQGPSAALSVCTRVMEALTLVALALDLATAGASITPSAWTIGDGLVRGVDALTQALAVVICVEAVSNPDPARLNGLLGRGIRALSVLAWGTFAAQMAVQGWAVASGPGLSIAGLAAPATAGAAWLLALSERQLLAATLWAREGRLLGSAG